MIKLIFSFFIFFFFYTSSAFADTGIHLWSASVQGPDGRRQYAYLIYDQNAANASYSPACLFYRPHDSYRYNMNVSLLRDCLGSAKTATELSAYRNLWIPATAASSIQSDNTFGIALFLWAWTDFATFGFFCLAIFAFVKMIPS